MSVDKYKLIHWLNIRKTTIDVLNLKLGNKINKELKVSDFANVNSYLANEIAKVLNIPKEKILKNHPNPTYVFATKQDINKTKRPITRDKIHFYNYYTLPVPEGYVAPVLIDVLCPKNKLPKLNNGHLESAITLSLGPEPVYLRTAKKIEKETFQKFDVNKSRKDSWVVGDTYFEPSYCLHTYCKANDGPGKILSYTTISHINELFRSKLNDNSFNQLKKLSQKNYINQILYHDILGRGYDLKYLSILIGIKSKTLTNLFNSKKKLPKNIIKKICRIVRLDENLYLPVASDGDQDKVGKNYLSYKKKIKSIRKYKSYLVTSLASSRKNPDLYGFYMKVNKKDKLKPNLDLLETGCSHYLVTKGNVNIYLKENKKIKKIVANEGDAIWISSLVNHCFTGNASLAKISDGQNFNYLEKQDIKRLFDIPFTLRRARKDIVNWGYDA